MITFKYFHKDEDVLFCLGMRLVVVVQCNDKYTPQRVILIRFMSHSGLEEEPTKSSKNGSSHKHLKRTSGDSSDLVPDKKHKPTPKPATKKSKFQF